MPATTARLIDVSHEGEHGMVTYPALPGPLICDFLSRQDSRAQYAPGTEIPIVEHLRGLEALPDRDARFFAVPVEVSGLGSFPVRAFAIAG